MKHIIYVESKGWVTWITTYDYQHGLSLFNLFVKTEGICHVRFYCETSVSGRQKNYSRYSEGGIPEPYFNSIKCAKYYSRYSEGGIPELAASAIGSYYYYSRYSEGGIPEQTRRYEPALGHYSRYSEGGIPEL